MSIRLHFKIAIFSLLALLGAAHPALAQRMHYLGIAASSRESVFQSEVSGAGSTVGSTWSLGSSQTVSGSFLGRVSYGAVRQAIQQAAGRMDRERDVLFLLVSSHGAPGGRGIELSAGGLMTPGMLRAALDEAGVRNRVVLVSACYSGAFVGPLSGPNTAVITASNAANPSFGCSNQRSYTYFGDAFFNHGMQQAGADIRRAFGVARTTVTAWERRDGQRPSQPQMSMGGGIAKTLAGVR
jgi:Peptidase C13 family